MIVLVICKISRRRKNIPSDDHFLEGEGEELTNSNIYSYDLYFRSILNNLQIISTMNYIGDNHSWDRNIENLQQYHQMRL